MFPTRPARNRTRWFASALCPGLIATALCGALGALPLGASAALTGQLQGHVTEAGTKVPVAGVTVAAAAPSGRYVTTTDAKGAYAIVGIVPDTYTLSFQKNGYGPFSTSGVTVLADATQIVDALLERNSLRTISHVVARSASNAFQPGQTEDSYTINSSTMQTILGKAFNTNENTLLSAAPSVTVDKTGTIFIRGGTSFETGYQLEGIDYSTPNSNLQNRSQNTGNFNLLNGVGAAQVVPGGGDASHGNTGTGLVSLTAKRGTNPGFGMIDLEINSDPFLHQLAFEYGTATGNGRFSNYLSYIGVRQAYQWGTFGTVGNTVGVFNDQYSARFGANIVNVPNYQTAANQESNDFLDNFFYRFGKNQNQQIQVFTQVQSIRQGYGYNGIANLCYASCSGAFAGYGGGPGSFASGLTDQQVEKEAPLYPGQVGFNQFVGEENAIYSPFYAGKIEYTNNVSPSTYYVVRAYQTNSDQTYDLPALGVYIPKYGGTRSAIGAEFTHQAGKSNLIQLGAKYEFDHPFGQNEDVANYENLLFHVGGPPFADPAADFAPASACIQPPSFPGGPPAPPPDSTIVGTGNGQYAIVPCGYLSKYFGNTIPRVPGEVDVPVNNQQIYGLFAQDTVTFSPRLKGQFGLRLDGYNFLQNVSSFAPPTVPQLLHQRLYEPHGGLTYRATSRDAFRITYGRTLAIPLAGEVGNDIQQSSLSAFDRIPSFDNLTGKPATYCGTNLTTACANYAQQLYWLLRDAKYPVSGISGPLRGATFTNYDLTYTRDLQHGYGLSLTPFYRRGYDVVEASNSVVGINGSTGLPIIGPTTYSNLGIQKATGVELLLSKESPTRLSGQLSATYINQLGSEPPGFYVPTTSVLLGNVYRSSQFAGVQGTLALNYRWASGWRVNPVFTYRSGYPYGVGTLTQVMIDGVPYNIPNSVNLATPANGSSNAILNQPIVTDPQNPGTKFAPIAIGNNGLIGGSSAGSLISHPTMNTDVTIEFHAPGSRATYGVAITNLYNQVYGVPVVNPYYYEAVTTGVPGPGTGSPPYFQKFGITNGQMPKAFAINANPYAPYLTLPNQPPIQARFYVQVGL